MESDASVSSIRTTKRKLEEAIRTLDSAIVSPSSATLTERPTPSKRPHLARSVYSTLAKFGVALKGQSRPSYDTPATSTPKSTPHLTAILARSASRRAPLPNLVSTLPVHPASEYRPSSSDSFLARLATYKITTYSNKPPQIDAVAAAKCGWLNDGRDRLICGLCDVSWVLVGREGMNKDAASVLVEKQRVSLVEMHKNGCPWKVRQCDASVYRVPLLTPVAMVRNLKTITQSLEPILTNTAVKHPLTPSQLKSLLSIFSAAASEEWTPDSDTGIDGTTHPTPPSEPAVLAALFGWVPAPISTHSEYRYTSSPFISCGELYGPSASVPPARSLSRASSISNHFRESESISTLSASPPRSTFQLNASPDRVGASSHTKNPFSSNTTVVPRNVSFVHCILCKRRVGLWEYSRNEGTAPPLRDKSHASAFFQHQKEFDLVKEHRSYCPYIACSSVLPSFSQSPTMDLLGSAMEGWRAVLTVVQRYELSQRQRMSRYKSSDDLNQAPVELQGVEAMVTGVKTHGGRELLRYVKGLLG